MKTEKKQIVIAHDIIGAIPNHEIYDTLKIDPENEELEIIHFPEDLKLEHGETKVVSWRSLKASQDKFFREYIQPILTKHENAPVYYFGLAPISMAIHLGCLYSSLRKVQVFLRHHGRESWEWRDIQTPELEKRGIPRDKFMGGGDVIFRFATAFEVDEKLTRRIVVEPCKDIEIRSQHVGRDIIGSESLLNEYAEAFRDALDEIKKYLEDIDAIHLFASVPVGLAFLIGRQVNKNITVPIYLYEYAQPGYQEAFILQEKSLEEFILSDEEKQEVMMVREQLSDHLKKVINIAEKPASIPENWFRHIFSKSRIGNTLFDTPIWNLLAPIYDTDLFESKFMYGPNDVTGEKYLINRNWFLSDELLHGLIKCFSNEGLLTVVRLFWFREIIKASSHGVHSDNRDELARYPKILEEVDYEADVYALLYEFKYSKVSKKSIAKFFWETIERMIQMMWSVDRFSDSKEMELHRVNHYLIWYYQLCMIKDRANELKEIIEILSKKPVIELRLVSVTTPDRSKIMLEFKNYNKSELGLALFHGNRVITSRQQLPLETLIEGFKNRSSDAIEGVMRQFIKDIV